ncbi:MAG: IS1595 family transposase [Hyphomonadaceae bacterium]|nr:IS1595 family transposase [Hyphomonadaceae bacterium]
MAQNFLLSSKARTLSLAQVMRLSEDDAFAIFKDIRWSETNGAPVCPKCASDAIYTYAARRIFKCKACARQFSATSGTIFASHKMALRDYLAAIAIFSNGAKGVAALALGRDLNVSYKTAFVLAHKLREAMTADQESAMLGGTVEIDGAYFGGYVKPENRKEDRRDRRLSETQSGKRKCVVVMRERKGRTLAFVAASEAAGARRIAAKVRRDAKVYADEGAGWDQLHAVFAVERVNHSVQFSDDGVCTNQAESFFSRLRRAEIGTHHHISGKYLQAYAGEMAWREDQSRKSNGGQFLLITAATAAHPVSRKWKGYWQRHAKA